MWKISQFRQTWIELDSQALKNNFLYLKSQTKSDFFCPMLKTNAYGHGSHLVAKALENESFSALGVGLLEEAIELRKCGVKKKIIQFGPFDSANLKELKKNQVTPVVSRWDQLHSLVGSQIEFHLKFETGMNRLGFKIQELPELKKMCSTSGLFPQAVMTHFHSGHDKQLCENQISNLETALNQWPELKSLPTHLLNSSSLLSWGNNSPWGARPGLALYGYSPLGENKNLRPVLSLKSKVVQVNAVQPGETVSYGASFAISKKTRIGVVPVGYADGYRRSFKDQAFVLCHGKRCKVLGNVTMDFVIIDLTPLESVPDLLFSEVVLIGGEITAETLAGWDQTIPWEILAGLNQRIHRVLV